MNTSLPGQDAPNFRQTGVRQGGRLYVGSAHSHHATHTMPAYNTKQSKDKPPSSIPTKFETVLYHGDNEADGFGGRTSRFKTDVADIPGPGHYDNAIKQKKKISFNSAGVDNRGLSFSSRDRRFRETIPDSGATIIGGRLVPGPGTYNGDKGFVRERKKYDFNTANVTRAFHDRTTYPLPEAQHTPNPGPAYYSPEKAELYHAERRNRKDRGLTGIRRRQEAAALQNRRTNGSDRREVIWTNVKSDKEMKLRMTTGGIGENTTIIERKEVLAKLWDDAARRRALINDQPFASTSVRFQTSSKSSNTPAPGSYNVMSSYKQTQPDNTIEAPFKSRTERAGIPSDAPTDVPAPGQYNHIQYGNRFGLDTKPSASFKTSNLTKFGETIEKHVIRQELPGPGSYNDHTLGGKEQQIHRMKGFSIGEFSNRTVPVTNMFPSSCIPAPHVMRKYDEIIRSGLNATAKLKRVPSGNIVPTSQIRPPGPSYYKPEEGFRLLQDKRDFHLNTTGKWI